VIAIVKTMFLLFNTTRINDWLILAVMADIAQAIRFRDAVILI